MSKSNTPANLMKFFHDPAKDLVTRAKNLLHKDKGYLYKSNKSLIKHELELFLIGKIY